VKLKKSPAIEEPWLDEKDFPVNLKEEVFIKHLDGPLFFGYTSDFQRIMNQIPSTAHYVILRMSKVPYIDQSGLFALEDVLIDLCNKDITILISGIQKQPDYRLSAIGIIPDLVKKEFVFNDFKSCMKWVTENVEDTPE